MNASPSSAPLQILYVPVVRQHLMFILSTASEEVLSLTFCSAPELRGVTSYRQQSNEVLMKASVFNGVECLWIIICFAQNSPLSFAGRVCVDQGIQQNKWDNNRSFKLRSYGFCYEKILFRKAWTASIVTHLHNPPFFSRVLSTMITNMRTATSDTNVYTSLLFHRKCAVWQNGG